MQQELKIRYQAGGNPGCSLAGHINQEVHVAVWCFLTACNRAEQTNVSGTMAGCHAQDLFAPFLKLFANAHNGYCIAGFYFAPESSA